VIVRCDQQCWTAARVSVTQLTHLVSACRQSRLDQRTAAVVKRALGGAVSSRMAGRSVLTLAYMITVVAPLAAAWNRLTYLQ